MYVCHLADDDAMECAQLLAWYCVDSIQELANDQHK